ncbi:MAG: hypothetical protein APF77_08165 [Clostridia bacterium BRH_c25]|nr:MAG: hypothetical protein APF77_08165 [Clostridia bacterium BRH_c25]
MKRVITLVLMVALIFSVVGCAANKTNNQAEATNQTTTEKSTPESGYKIGVLMKTMSDTYSNKLGEAIKAYAAEKYPNATLYLLDGQADIAKQISQAEDLIAKQVNVIILNPQDADGSAQVLDLAAKAKIPVIEVNTETTRTDYVSYVGSDDVKAGEIMGNFVNDKLGGKGKIAILEGEMGQSAQIKRYEGLKNTILKSSGIECVATLSASWSRDKAMATTEDWLGKYSDLAAVICENDDMAMGALQAAESQNKKIVIIGTDAIPDALKAVKEGRLSGTVLQDANGQATTAVDVAVKVAAGEKVDSRYDVPFQLITSENVDQFLK